MDLSCKSVIPKYRKKLDLREVGERRLEGNLVFQRLKQCDADEEDAEEKEEGDEDDEEDGDKA